MANKKTVKEFFEEVREVLVEYGNQELVDFIDTRIEINNKKRSGESKTKTENIEIAEMLIQELSKFENAITVTELLTNSDEVRNYTYEVKEDGEIKNKHLTNQKVIAILNSLVDKKNPENPDSNFKIKKSTSKGKTYFTVNE